MLDLDNGGLHWNDLRTKCKGWDTDSGLQWFYARILDIQKLKSGLGKDMLSVPELVGLTEKVASSSGYDQLQTILDKAIFAQKSLNGQANPNPQMLIETLLIDWISLLGQARN
jgi:hypothetical protein